jgi:hypothetical protein
MIPIEKLIRSKLALLLWSENEAGEDEATVFVGAVVCEGTRLLFRGQGGSSLELDGEWLGRIKPVDAELADIFRSADYYLPLSVGPLPPGEAASDFLRTGLRWPDRSG